MRRKQIIEEHFDTADWQDDWSPRYNIAPTQPVPVVRRIGSRPTGFVMRWGLIPSWAKDSAASQINARQREAARQTIKRRLSIVKRGYRVPALQRPSESKSVVRLHFRICRCRSARLCGRVTKPGIRMHIATCSCAIVLNWEARQELARVDMKVSTLPAPVENFSISYDKSGTGCTLQMDWETTRASVDITPK